jgi:hypothetical protein
MSLYVEEFVSDDEEDGSGMQILKFRKHKRFIYSISFSADC